MCIVYMYIMNYICYMTHIFRDLGSMSIWFLPHTKLYFIFILLFDIRN